MDKGQQILVELAYALPDSQVIIPVKVAVGTSLYEAAVQSKITERYSQIDLEQVKMGIFGKMVKDPKAEVVQPGDRIEIYRPLLIDPKASRLARAEKAEKAKKTKRSDGG